MIIAPPLVMTRADIDDMMKLIIQCLDLTLSEAKNKGWC
jgi:putrescine aminotransferase